MNQELGTRRHPVTFLELKRKANPATSMQSPLMSKNLPEYSLTRYEVTGFSRVFFTLQPYYALGRIFLRISGMARIEKRMLLQTIKSMMVIMANLKKIIGLHQSHGFHIDESVQDAGLKITADNDQQMAVVNMSRRSHGECICIISPPCCP
jgi:hypothetical protein